ncbi:hypothetical protein [Ruminococcus albus]|uniref:Urease alpha-subunit, N-terminal domain n=1 Tax=Ruminococcus albus TaxID=1264 RepID=A0A1I1ICI6_RUMAL|nr:hypothetical protein [Ruminococcus albus]SFC33731.1 Urease alpha-subunit, N-terminal domain [Ruminococcus albus]
MKYHVNDTLTLCKGRTVSIEKDLTASGEKFDTANVDIVIRNAAVIGADSVYKADIAITDGRISAIGGADDKPCRQIDAEGLVLTAGRVRTVSGALDSYMLEELLFSGVSTLTFDSQPSDNDIKMMLEHPLNYCVCFDGQPHDSDELLHHVGDVALGRIADLYLWKCEKFNIAPEKIIKFGRCIFDRSLTDRKDIIYALSYDTTRRPARSASVFFTSHNDVNGYFGRLYETEHTMIALDTNK